MHPPKPTINPAAIDITTEAIQSLPLRAFEGKVHVITDLHQLQRVLPYLRDQPMVGFDTETRPSFKKGQYFPVSLIQLATREKAFLIRLKHVGLAQDIVHVLENVTLIKAGVALHDDIKALQKLQPFAAAGFVDLAQRARQTGLQVESVKKLTALLLGFRISKSAQTSNWDDVTLNEKQISYAATDAWVCWEIYQKLHPAG
jgi:ribonuclease D